MLTDLIPFINDPNLTRPGTIARSKDHSLLYASGNTTAWHIGIRKQ
jgi:hypothetical protein